MLLNIRRLLVLAGLVVPVFLSGGAAAELRSDAVPLTASCRRDVLAAAREVAPNLGSLRTLIATVPDPIDSPSARLFDDFVAAISSALGRAGYFRDRFCDPWSETKPCVPESALQCRETTPGFILFRKEPRPPADVDGDVDVYAVLLVGEVPTWGVHTGAARQALDRALALQTLQQSAAPRRIDILGHLDAEGQTRSIGARPPGAPVADPATSGH